MRLAYSYVASDDRRAQQRNLPQSSSEFSQQMAYKKEDEQTPEEFLDSTNEQWVLELRAVLRELLDPGRTILSVGSGKGEHEVPLFLEGYAITASDIVEEALCSAKKLFPGFSAVYFDVLNPQVDKGVQYEDVLATGIDSQLDDQQLEQVFVTAERICKPGVRVILVHRYNDNAATRIIDQFCLPIWATVQHAYHWIRRDGIRIVKREHGWRRSRQEIVSIANRAGFSLERVRYAAYAMELARLPVPIFIRKAIGRIDRRVKTLNSATVFEFLISTDLATDSGSSSQIE